MLNKFGSRPSSEVVSRKSLKPVELKPCFWGVLDKCVFFVGPKKTKLSNEKKLVV